MTISFLNSPRALDESPNCLLELAGHLLLQYASRDNNASLTGPPSPRPVRPRSEPRNACRRRTQSSSLHSKSTNGLVCCGLVSSSRNHRRHTRHSTLSIEGSPRRACAKSLPLLAVPKARHPLPDGLDDDTPTGSILRLPEVDRAITGDFLILPCDLISELPLESLLDIWLIHQDPLHLSSTLGHPQPPSGSRLTSGLSVFYNTKTSHHTKNTETDFITTAPLPKSPIPPPSSSLLSNVSQLVNAMTTDTLHDKLSANGSLPIRHGLLRAHPRTRLLTSHRDAHIYILPHWLLAHARANPKLDTIGEDLVGWWAKATWQKGLAEKLHFPHNHVPQVLAYIHPTSSPLVQRVDTPTQLLATSLYLATLEPSSTPHAHAHKRSPQAVVPPNTSVADANCLIGPFSTIGAQNTMKETVIGANCVTGQRVRLTKCVVMDGAVIEDNAVLVDCVVGARAKVGRRCVLSECVVQGGFVVEEGTEGRKETFVGGGGLDEGEVDLDVEEDVTEEDSDGDGGGEVEED